MNGADHDANFNAVLDRIQQCGLALNEKKCVLKKRSLVFQSYVFSDQGIAPDPEKIKAGVEFPTPENASEVRSLLGMINFCCRFIRNYANITEPLQKSIKKDTPFLWTKRQNEALGELRVALSNAPKNAYFNST